MKKLTKLLDKYLLKFGTALAILFIPLYPKLPSIHVPQTWVYIRLEDFLILGLTIIWIIQLIRKKVTLPRPEGYALIVYWIAGLVSLLYCLIFIAPDLVNFFPKIAAFQYVRRIEYMILFFIGFSSVKDMRDVIFYLKTLMIALVGIILYGFGQRFYMILWKLYPTFFQQYPFCFPAFLTGNEEFAKGAPLCLNETSRITSTFGGHYDLSAYLVFVIPIIVALVFSVRKKMYKIALSILALFALELLNFTSSRTSFGAYVIGIVGMLVLWQKKKWIIPILLVSIAVMMLFGNATIQRFSKTIQEVQVVSSEEQLPSDLQKIISDAKEAENIKKSEVPPPSDFTVNKDALTPNANGYTTTLTQEQLNRIQSGELSISTVSGSFLIKKAYALDISFTTRFQGEWPRNWNAFLYSPLFGTGYSSLTLATDNDYLRALGETGLVGTIAFFMIFFVLGIYAHNVLRTITNPLVKGLLFGLVGGMIGLLANAVLIDVFEASKVAESMWLLLGIGMGAATLSTKKKIPYKKAFFSIFTSRFMIAVFFLLLILTAFGASIHTFFVGDDFIWLRWAASSSPADFGRYFIDADNFFYRPFTKIISYYLYAIFSLQPQGYHLFGLLLHFFSTFGVFLLAKNIFKNKLLGFLTGLLFALHPLHSENVYWFSTLSGNLSNIFVVYSLLTFYYYREKNNVLFYILSVFLGACALMSYEMSVILPLLILLIDLTFFGPRLNRSTVLHYFPYVVLIFVYFVLRYISQAFMSGGDYSYNLVKIVPNVIGNYIGYLALFVGGHSAYPWYESMRSVMKTQWMLITIILVFVFGGILYLMKRYRTQAVSICKGDCAIVLFGLLFSFIALLPFLPLGNIASRYLYTASIGFSVSLIMVIGMLTKKFVSRESFQKWIMIVVVLLLAVFYWVQNNTEMQKWTAAGNISKETLTFFRVNYSGFTKDTKLYFVHTPITYQGAWVFPVGLVDGLWFIYRENTPFVYDRVSLDQGRDAKRLSPTRTFIYRFDNGVIHEVK